MSGSDADRLRMRSVARIVRATLAALVQGNDGELGKLGVHARGVLERARAVQEKNTGTWMMTLPSGTYEYGDVSFGLGDVVAEKKRSDGRPLHMSTLRNTMAHWIDKSLSVDELADVFFDLVESPHRSFPMLRDEGLPSLPPDAVARIRRAFSDLAQKAAPHASHEDRAERLIIQGMKAIGMPKNAAESLFDFEKKATKRRGGTAR